MVRWTIQYKDYMNPYLTEVNIDVYINEWFHEVARGTSKILMIIYVDFINAFIWFDQILIIKSGFYFVPTYGRSLTRGSYELTVVPWLF